MNDVRHPVTPAIHFLREQNVEFKPHLFKYEEKGGTKVSSRELGVSENIVIKTLIMETDQKAPLIVLMHGDKQVSTKELARLIGTKSISPAAPEIANRHSGYQVGGTSPFGTRKAMPIYMQDSIAALDRIFINGGGRGFLVEIKTQDLIRTLAPTLVNVAIEPTPRAGAKAR